jgi:hypothetical protein
MKRGEWSASHMGDETAKLTGVWILRSARLERVDTGETILPYGDNPRGVLILHEGVGARVRLTARGVAAT